MTHSDENEAQGLSGEPLLTQLLADPKKAHAELSLLEFTKQAWQVLEPEVDFVSGWAVEAIAEHLQAVTDGQIRRLLINVPPGCTKSMMTNVMWPAWEWGPRGKANHRFISASYEQGLATRDLVRCRDLVLSEWFQQRWPITLKGDQNEKTYYETSRTGWRKSASVRSALTGYRGDRIIIDDPHSVKTAESDADRNESLRWFTETVPTRLNKAGESAIVVIMQRLHEQDIAGLILEDLAQDYTHLMLPMEYERERHCKTMVVMPSGETFEDPRTEEDELLWKERFPAEANEETKRALRSHGGEYAVAAQLQQRPAPRGGGAFKKDDFIIVDDIPEFQRPVRGWDLAATSKKKNPNAAYTAGVKMARTTDGRLIILNIVRAQASPGEVKRMLKRTAQADGAYCQISLPQDPGQAGKAQIADLVALLEGFEAYGSPESGDKEMRAFPFAAQVEAGNVLLARGGWNKDFLKEAEMFPNGRFKDQIDACSRAYAWLLQNRDPNIGIVPATLFEQ